MGDRLICSVERAWIESKWLGAERETETDRKDGEKVRGQFASAGRAGEIGGGRCLSLKGTGTQVRGKVNRKHCSPSVTRDILA